MGTSGFAAYIPRAQGKGGPNWSRWDKNREAREAQDERPPETPADRRVPDRVPESERDGSGGRHFRDALHERTFAEACEALHMDVKNLQLHRG